MTAAAAHDVRADALAVVMPGFVGTTLPEWVEAYLEQGLGAVCLFGHNVESTAQLAALTAAIVERNPGVIVSIDEEGGDVSRLYQHDGSPFPGNAVLGRIDDLDTTRSVGREVGARLLEVGVHLTLAPDADVNSNPDNPVIGVRSFGADPAAVAAHTAAWIDGVQSTGVAACAKHFPGHGDTSTDSHLSEPVVAADAATLEGRELVPFAAAVECGSKTIMTSHIRVPALDADSVATFSPVVFGDVLRGSLGFDGVIVTDALDMAGASGERGLPGAAVAALAAGADLLCLGSNNSEDEVAEIVDALTRAELRGELPDGRLADAAERCRGLARWARDEQLAADDVAPSCGPVVDPDRVAASFTLSARAEEMLADPRGPVRWVRIDPEPNIAIGSTPFGPFFDGGAAPSFVVPLDDRSRASSFVAEPDVTTLIVGRELHRDAEALDAATTVASRCDGLIVDMGFAPNDRVDIATFGASRLVGEALLRLVGAGR